MPSLIMNTLQFVSRSILAVSFYAMGVFWSDNRCPSVLIPAPLMCALRHSGSDPSFSAFHHWPVWLRRFCRWLWSPFARLGRCCLHKRKRTMGPPPHPSEPPPSAIPLQECTPAVASQSSSATVSDISPSVPSSPVIPALVAPQLTVAAGPPSPQHPPAADGRSSPPVVAVEPAPPPLPSAARLRVRLAVSPSSSPRPLSPVVPGQTATGEPSAVGAGLDTLCPVMPRSISLVQRPPSLLVLDTSSQPILGPASTAAQGADQHTQPSDERSGAISLASVSLVVEDGVQMVVPIASVSTSPPASGDQSMMKTNAPVRVPTLPQEEPLPLPAGSPGSTTPAGVLSPSSPSPVTPAVAPSSPSKISRAPSPAGTSSPPPDARTSQAAPPVTTAPQTPPFAGAAVVTVAKTSTAFDGALSAPDLKGPRFSWVIFVAHLVGKFILAPAVTLGVAVMLQLPRPWRDVGCDAPSKAA